MTDKLRCSGLFFLTLALLASVLVGCSKVPAEVQIRKNLDAMQSAIVQRRAGEFVAVLSVDFQGSEGLDRNQLRQMLSVMLLGEQNVSVTFLGPAEVKLFNPERAIVKATVLATGGRWLPDHGRRFEIESGWRLEDGNWVCYTASWN